MEVAKELELPGAAEGLNAELKSEIASNAALLKAQASFALDDETGALGTLKKLRADFPREKAAKVSVFVEARHYADQEKTDAAQQLFYQFADDFPQDDLAAEALYQAALQAVRRENLEEANRRLVDLITRYPDHPLVFTAYLKQGDLLRLLNQFPQAQQVYELLVNRFAQRPDVVKAQLALAETLNAQASGDSEQAARALVLFEKVLEAGPMHRSMSGSKPALIVEWCWPRGVKWKRQRPVVAGRRHALPAGSCERDKAGRKRTLVDVANAARTRRSA